MSSGEPIQSRLSLLVTAVGITGLAVSVWAGAVLSGSSLSLVRVGELAAFLAAAIFTEALPVPMHGVPAGGVSLAAVLLVSGGFLFGWPTATVLGLLTRGAVELAQRRPASRMIYNSAVYALSAAAAAAVCASLALGGPGGLALSIVVGSATFYAVNVFLIACVLALTTGGRFSAVLRRSTASTLAPFGIMASVAVLLAALWRFSPPLSVALVGPFLAVGLYQRSAHRALEAMQLARTDPLTGLGNHRAFQERLSQELERASGLGESLALSLLDLDDFKGVNDRYGHPQGDRVLQAVADCLGRGGDGFRLGGDEFALILPGCDRRAACLQVERVVRRIAATEIQPSLQMAISAGIACYPDEATTGTELVRAADRALYTTKASREALPKIVRGESAHRPRLALAQGPEHRDKLAAVAALAHSLDARSSELGRHSRAVAELAARIALRLGLDAEERRLIHVAGLLHDLGKLAAADALLNKPGQLTLAERHELRRHPQIGQQMLVPLDIEPADLWVRHHHERWDGQGYPDRLVGAETPLAARILLVADAYDAMTTPRAYRESCGHAEAIAELERCAGSQFDPSVVEAALEELSGETFAAAASLTS